MQEPEIRPALDSDVPRLTEIYNHYILETAFTFDVEPFSSERRREEWFAKFDTRGPHRLLVADAQGELLGFASSRPFRPKQAYETSVETSIYLVAEATGRGVGPRLYGELFAELAAEDVHRALALITLPNEPSEALHRRMGFELSGVWSDVGRKFDRFWDVAVWQRPIVLER